MQNLKKAEEGQEKQPSPRESKQRQKEREAKGNTKPEQQWQSQGTTAGDRQGGPQLGKGGWHHPALDSHVWGQGTITRKLFLWFPLSL